MQQAGVTQIDAFVNSDYHEDHFGGIDELVDAGVMVLQGYDRGDKNCCLPASKKNQLTYKDYQRTVGEDAIALRAGDTINLDLLVTITVISSGGIVIGEANGTPGAEENDMSVSLLIAFRGFKAFFGGDTEVPTETKIAARDLVLNVDLYKANHHGSHSSSSQAFMGDLKPAVAIISNASDGTYKPPRQVTLNTVRGAYTCSRSVSDEQVPAARTLRECTGCRHCGSPNHWRERDDSGHRRPNECLHRRLRGYDADVPDQGADNCAVNVHHCDYISPAQSVGSDEQLESVTIRNKGGAAVSFAGRTLQDRSGVTWNHTGSLAAGATRTFRRNGQAMSLNNSGDEVVLLDGSNTERDRFAFGAVAEGATIATQH
jgi:hypothetical protein